MNIPLFNHEKNSLFGEKGDPSQTQTARQVVAADLWPGSQRQRGGRGSAGSQRGGVVPGGCDPGENGRGFLQLKTGDLYK